MRIALVLGSGGARGYAHIGIIDELKARGHQIVAISGTSMGALVGGLEASGCLEEFREWATSLTQLDVWRRMDITFTGAGLVKAEKVIGEIGSMMGGVRIEDLPIPYTAVAADITSQREVWFQRGPLTSAIRASIAIPSVITPVMMGGHILVDGGLCNPVPVEPTLSVPSDVTVSVSLAGRPFVVSADAMASTVDGSDVSELEEGSTIFRRLPFVGRGKGVVNTEMNDDVVAAHDSEDGSTETNADRIRPAGRKEVSRMELINESIDTMQGMIERYRAAASPAQIQITVPYASASTLDFHRATELIALGRELAVEAFDRAGL